MICDAMIYVFVHDDVMIILMLLINASDLWMHDFWWWWIIGDVLHNANMMRWYIYLVLDKLWRCGLYANFDERRWFFCVVLFYCRVTYIALATMGFYATRRWAFMPSDEAFMPSVPIYGQSDGYHMHNIVVSHGVGYVYVWVVWRWVFNWLTLIELR